MGILCFSYLEIMSTLPDISRSLSTRHRAHRLLLVETNGRPSEGITELFAAIALRGSFYAIASGEWLPTYALAHTIRKHTTAIHQVLGRVRLARPFTCYQVLDLLTDIRPECDPVLVLDFLHHFHNPDVRLDVRKRVLEQCCRRLEHLSLSRIVLVFVQSLDTEEYRSFIPILANTADDVVQVAEADTIETLQPILF
jgi:hypothetical protein